MADLVLSLPGKLFFGTDVINRIGAVVGEWGKRAILVTESVIQEGDYVDRVSELLGRRGIECIVSTELSPGASAAVVDDICALARAGKAQVVIGMGGMRCLQTAFACSLLISGTSKVEELLAGERLSNEPLPYIEVPAACRNHFMMQERCILTDDESRYPVLIQSEKKCAKSIFLDPGIAQSLSEKYMAAVLLDIMLAAIEGYLSEKSGFFSDGLFLESLRISYNALQGFTLTKSDLDFYELACQAGLLAGLGLSVSSQGGGAALCYSINSLHSIPKSWLATIFLPHIIDSSIGARAEKIATIAEVFGEDVSGMRPGEAAFRGSAIVRRLIGKYKLPARLRDFNLSLDDLTDAAEAAAKLPMLSFAPVPVSANGLYDIIKQAF